MAEPTATPLSFLDHLRASAPAPHAAIAPQKSKQAASAVERVLLECFGPGFALEPGDQQLVCASAWFAGLDAAAAVLSHPGEEESGETAFLALDRRTAILMTTAQLGGAAMLGQTDTGRSLTAIEEGFLASFGAALLHAVQQQTNAAAAIRLLDPLTASPLIPAAAMLTVFTFTILHGETRLPFLLALPCEAIQQTQGSATETAASTAWKSALGSELTRSRVRLEASIDLGHLPLSRLRILLPGDIIPIPEGALGKTVLMSRGETLLTGRLGKLAGAYSVRVTAAAPAKSSPLQGLMNSAGAKINTLSETRS